MVVICIYNYSIQGKLRDKKCDVINFNDGYFGASDTPKTKEELQKYHALKNKVL